MQTNGTTRIGWIAGIVAVWLAGLTTVHGVANNWSAAGDGAWQTAGNWSASHAPTNTDDIAIGNAGTKVVTIDATTSGSFPLTMTVASLTLNSGNATSTNTLSLSNAGTAVPLHVLGQALAGSSKYAVLRLDNSALQVDSASWVGDNNPVQVWLLNGSTMLWGGNLTFGGHSGANGSRLDATNGVLQVNGTFHLGSLDSAAGKTATVNMVGGQLTVTNASTSLNLGSGSAAGVLATSNTLVQLRTLTFTYGQAAFVGGTNLISSLTLGANAGSLQLAGLTNQAGTITVSGGSITADAGVLVITNGAGTSWLAGGSLTISNTSTRLLAGQVTIGNNGQLTVNAGSHDLRYILMNGNASSLVTINGGTVVTTNTVSGNIIGDNSPGTLIVSNGTLITDGFSVMFHSGANGSLVKVAGGNVIAALPSSSAGALSVIGRGDGAGNTGIWWTASGTATFTNSAANQTLEIRYGKLLLDGGTTTVDTLSFTKTTNSLAQFNGGTLRVRSSSGYKGNLLVGDGSNAAKLELRGGTVTLTDGLTLNTNATLCGTGTLSGVITSCSGTVAPEDDAGMPGTLTVGGLTMTSTGGLAVKLNGGVATGKVVVTAGTVTLANSTLNAQWDGVDLGTPDVYILVSGGSSAISDTFNGLAEGATIDLGHGRSCRISYQGNADAGATANDVRLYDFCTVRGTTFRFR